MARPLSGGCSTSGFVLVVVLWTLGLLSLVVLTLSFVVRLEAKSTANIKHNAQAELLADGVVRLAAADTAAARSLSLRGAPAKSGGAYACRLGGGAVVVTLTDVAGLIDLNAASWNTLLRLFKYAGLRPGSAGVRAKEVTDFRDRDDEAHRQRSEEQDYLKAGRTLGPKNAPYQSVAELDQVIGMTPQLLAGIRPLVTVHSHTRDVELEVAPDAVIAAITNDDPFSARAKARAARIAADDTISAQQRLAPTLRAFDVRVLVVLANRAQAFRHAVFKLDAGSPLGFSVSEWESGAPTVAEAGLAGLRDLPACFELGN